MFNILVAEDDASTRRLMCTVLENNGYHVIPAEDGKVALKLIEENHVDLLIADVMMPNMDGYALTKELRDFHFDLPILMVTARETPQDKRRGFLAGTDDYMVKPVDEEEMLLRIQALLRRAKIASDKRIVIGQTTLDYNSFSLTDPNGTQTLPQKEFLLLFLFLSYPTKIFTRRNLMDEIWDMESESDERTVDVHINRVRDRIRTNPDIEILTLRGLGYKAVIKSNT